MLHERSKRVFILAQLKTYLLSLRRVVLARLKADEEVHLMPYMLVVGIHVHIVVFAVVSFLAGVLTMTSIKPVP